MSAWTLEVEDARWGLVPRVDFIAARKCGRIERFDVSLWPAGWRILRLGLDVPQSVRTEAMRVAKEIWGEV